MNIIGKLSCGLFGFGRDFRNLGLGRRRQQGMRPAGLNVSEVVVEGSWLNPSGGDMIEHVIIFVGAVCLSSNLAI